MAPLVRARTTPGLGRDGAQARQAVERGAYAWPGRGGVAGGSQSECAGSAGTVKSTSASSAAATSASAWPSTWNSLRCLPRNPQIANA